MPLMKGKSPKAFEHNIKAEISSGKPKAQALAISYDIQRKNKKRKAAGGSVQSGSPDMNMAEGGMINVKNQKRPMPENLHNDKMMADMNRGNKPAKNDSFTDNPTVKQAQMNSGRKVMPIKRPKMVPSDVFSTRLYDKEGNLEENAKPGPYGEQPESDMNEMGAERQGPNVRDMQDEHSTRMKPYKMEMEHDDSMDESEEDMRQKYAKGGEIEESDRESRNIKMRTSMEPMDDSEEMYERKDQNDHMMEDAPSEDEGAMHARELDEMDQDSSGNDVPDMEEPHNSEEDKVYGYADGGEIGRSSDDSEMQPEDEEMEEHHDSIASAIMARKDRRAAQMSDSDMDEMMRLYNGGEITSRRNPSSIKSHDSIYSDDSDQADLSRNADEDANEEDQLSFNSLMKENYDESHSLKQADSPMDSAQHGDDEEMDSHDKHDMVESIRRKMMKKRQF